MVFTIKEEKEMTIELKRKLDEKIAKLNSQSYKKVTFRGDLSWYIKASYTYYLMFMQ